VDANVFRHFETIPFYPFLISGEIPDYVGPPTQRCAAILAYNSELSIVTALVDVQNGSDSVLAGALRFFDAHQKAFTNTLVLQDWSRQILTKSRLDTIRKTLQFLDRVVREQDAWRRRRPEMQTEVVQLLLPLLRTLVDLLVHPNLFAEIMVPVSDTEKKEAADTKEYTGNCPRLDLSTRFAKVMQTEILLIVKDILSLLHRLTLANLPFVSPPKEWDARSLVFHPSLGTSRQSNTPVALGTLNLLIAYCKEKLSDIGRRGAPDTETKKLTFLLELMEMTYLLYASQLVYALHSPNWEARQKEQIAVETGTELLLALDAVTDLSEWYGSRRHLIQRGMDLAERLKNYIELMTQQRQ
jgi:hypothetical protein